MPRLFCFGLGYSATALADALLADDWQVAGTCRDAGKQAALRSRGIDAHLFDRGRPLVDAAAVLAGTTHLLSSVPPDAEGDPVLAAHGGTIAALPGVRWAGYLSTVGVYGDRQGGWVDEGADLSASSQRGRRRVMAEGAWLDLWRAHGLPVHLFRLAGIYGPGRSAIDQVRAGTARRIDKPGQVFNRIHVDDIVAIVRASMARSNPGAAYNCADDRPAPSHAVVAFACALLGVEPPPLQPFETAALSPMARDFYGENKRVSNRRFKDELGVALIHPTYEAGLRAQLEPEHHARADRGGTAAGSS